MDITLLIGVVLFLIGILLAYSMFRLFQTIEVNSYKQKVYVSSLVISIFCAIISAVVFNHFITLGNIVTGTLG